MGLGFLDSWFWVYMVVDPLWILDVWLTAEWDLGLTV